MAETLPAAAARRDPYPYSNPGPKPCACPRTVRPHPAGTEDLSDLYAESTPTILGFDDDAVNAQTAKGGAIARWDLEDGHRSDLGDNEYPVT